MNQQILILCEHFGLCSLDCPSSNSTDKNIDYCYVPIRDQIGGSNRQINLAITFTENAQHTFSSLVPHKTPGNGTTILKSQWCYKKLPFRQLYSRSVVSLIRNTFTLQTGSQCLCTVR